MYRSILESQKLFLRSRRPLSLEYRLDALRSLKASIKRFEGDIIRALELDLGKHEVEAYSTEVGFIYQSIDHALKNLRRWIKPIRVKSDLAQFPGRSYIYPSEYGAVLIIGPYNYPFQLVIEPLIGAIAGGNTAIVKPSEFTPAVESIIKKIIGDAFSTDYISVVTGDYKVNSVLLDLNFDYIFFTGSIAVGKIVMEKASANLTPVTLELGGKSPTIVHPSADLDLAAKKITWGKLLNSGQTCVAPDYVLVHESVAEEFLEKMKHTIKDFYGDDIKSNSEYGRIVNKKHMIRLQSILESDCEQIIFGGKSDLEKRYIEPTILYPMTLDDASMEDEIFGPILPVTTYACIEDIDSFIDAHPTPLSLYVFSRDEDFSESILKRYSFGGGCINDTIIHVASRYLPFGGVGRSGMGMYHGKSSFDTFTHQKTIVKKSKLVSFDFVHPPYGNKLKWVKKLMK